MRRGISWTVTGDASGAVPVGDRAWAEGNPFDGTSQRSAIFDVTFGYGVDERSVRCEPSDEESGWHEHSEVEIGRGLGETPGYRRQCGHRFDSFSR